MNDRIKEMILEAGFVGYGEDLGSYNIPVPAFNGRMEKFTRLIVRECVNVLETEIGRLTEYGNSVDNEDYKYDVDICIQKCIDNIINLKEHFGVDKRE